MSKINLTIMIDNSPDVVFIGGNTKKDGTVDWQEKIGRTNILYTALYDCKDNLAKTPGEVINNLYGVFRHGYNLTMEAKK